MKKELKILLADDHSVVRHGISLILKEAFTAPAILHADNFTAVLSMLSEMPDLIFLDINLPDGNSPKMIRKIRDLLPEVLILMFSAYDEEQYALRYIHAGANGFLNKHSSEAEIIHAVHTVIATKKYLSPKVKEQLFENAFHKTFINPLDCLSNREFEVAGLLAKGEGNLEISNRLNVHKTTISTYKNRIFEKLNINNIVCLIDFFRVHEE